MDAPKVYTFHHTILFRPGIAGPVGANRFMSVKLYGNLAGDEYGLNSERLIVVGNKK
jgi:hypothetical protein